MRYTIDLYMFSAIEWPSQHYRKASQEEIKKPENNASRLKHKYRNFYKSFSINPLLQLVRSPGFRGFVFGLFVLGSYLD